MDIKSHSDTNASKPPITYTVCNGLSNQLLGHAAYIANAAESARELLIPDAFIVNGVQNEKEGNSLKNVLSSKDNSLPLSDVIDTDNLLEKLKTLGVNARLEPFDQVVARTSTINPESCEWLETLKAANPQIAREVLLSFKPSSAFSVLIDTNLGNMLHRVGDTASLSDGICLHHRDGQDWKEHCKQWENIPDNVWRKNCLNDRGLPLHELVKNRIPEKSPKSWIYFIGDEDPSNELIEQFESIGINLINRHRDGLVRNEDIAKMVHLENISTATHRDLFSFVDFFTCAEIKNFIGNSVSKFSTNQIALRNGMDSSWYNSRSIPMATIFSAYNTPIVYTYTEESQAAGKSLLKASILSVRGVFGITTNIHILYHGTKDKVFLNWLDGNGVIVHNHEPAWLDTIEEMRLNGDPQRSHLFLHKGNYIGTWQRIDIPLFLNAEYVLFLDCDTIVSTAFGMQDFGLEITPGVAISAEFSEQDNTPWNMGVALLNVPKLRETHARFLQFIRSHVKNPVFKGGNISDQGAYLEFYERDDNMRFLDRTFNVKPYWKEPRHFAERKVVHFHGLKPHEILKIWLKYPANSFSEALQGLVAYVTNEVSVSTLCLVMHDFSKYIVRDVNDLNDYCGAQFEKDGEEKIDICIKFWTALAKEDDASVGSCVDRVL